MVLQRKVLLDKLSMRSKCSVKMFSVFLIQSERSVTNVPSS